MVEAKVERMLGAFHFFCIGKSEISYIYICSKPSLSEDLWNQQNLRYKRCFGNKPWGLKSRKSVL